MKTTTTTTTGAGDSAAQILNNLTLAQAYAHAATDDKAAYIVELLGVKSIHSPLFVEMEDAIEERFHQLRVADNRNGWHKVSAVRILDVKDAVFASHDYNQGPQTCLVHDIGEARLYHKAAQIEQAAHMLASFLGQLVDEGHLDALGAQDTMSGMTPKFAALRLLDRFDGIAYGD